MNIKERIYRLCSEQGLTIAKFEKECGFSNGYVSSIRKNIGIDKLDSILRIFPNLNRDWLLYGTGEMLRSPEEQINTETSTQDTECEEVQTEEVTLASIPIVPPAIIDQPDVIIEQDVEMNSSEYEKLNLERIIRMVDIAYRVQTEKLAPYVNIGDILLLQKLKGEEEVRNSELHLIKTKHQGTYLRYTFDEGDQYRLAATNRAPECYIPKNKVREIFVFICNISFSVAMPDYLTNKQLRQQGKQISTLVDSINNLVTATLDEGKRTDKVLQMLEKQIEINAKNQ